MNPIRNASYMIFDEMTESRIRLSGIVSLPGMYWKYPPQDLQVRLGHFVMAGDGRGTA